MIVPVAFAVLMAFLLTPLVSFFQRWSTGAGGAAGVNAAFVPLGSAGWLITQQLMSLVEELPACCAVSDPA